MLPLDGYVRVSRVGGREGEGFISPDVQESALREWANRNGHTLVVQPHELNVSGGTMDRPVFNSIMERIRSGQSGGLAVYKIDRFSRSLLGAVSTLAELGEHDAMFASATEPTLDYSTPAGRAFMQQMFVFAEFTRSTLKEGWATAARHAVERGIHISPNGYLGYVKADGRLVPNDEAPIAVEVFRRRGAGESWGSVAEWLNDVVPRPGEKRWNGQSIQRLCSKRIYRGEASRYVEQDVDGRGPVVNREAHPALVTETEWQAAQMNPRVAQGGRRDGKPLPLLSGLIRCAGCRYSLSVGRGPQGERLYRCRAKHASGTCPSPASVIAETIENHVEEAVLAQIEGIAHLVPDSRERDNAAQELEQARGDLDGFRRDRTARRTLGAEWNDWLGDYMRAVREAEAELQHVDTRVGAAEAGLTSEHYSALPTDARREVLQGFLDTVIVRRSRGRGRNVDPIEVRSAVLWRGEAPTDLPRPRVSSPIVPFAFEGEGHVEAGSAAA